MFQNLSQRFVQVHPSITDIEAHRQSKLLNQLSLIVIILNFIAGALTFIVALQSERFPLEASIAWGSIIVPLAAFILNQRGQYRQGAWLLIGGLFATMSVLSSQEYLGFVFFVPVILLSTMFLKESETIVLAGIALAISIALALLNSTVQESISSFYPLNISVISIPIIIMAMIHRRKIEVERRHVLEASNERLRQSEILLEKRVAERTQELAYVNQELETALDVAQAAEKMKSQFLASTSHELRTPLNAILNFNEFVASGMLGTVTDKQRDALQKALDSGRHLLALINDVLDISKIESGMMQLFVEDNISIPHELSQVISATETLLKHKPEVQFTHAIAADLPLLVGDRRRIRQILLNLCSNACKFTEKGSVHLSAEVEGEDLLFSVKDTGYGIAEEDQQIIFEPFRQTERGIQHMGGTGLGLPISLRLAEAHGGKLWVESVMGQGATFYVRLPIRSERLLDILASTS